MLLVSILLWQTQIYKIPTKSKRRKYNFYRTFRNQSQLPLKVFVDDLQIILFKKLNWNISNLNKFIFELSSIYSRPRKKIYYLPSKTDRNDSEMFVKTT